MQGVLAATCTLFGVLWLRAVVRVRLSVLQRSAMLQRMATTTAALDGSGLSATVAGIVRLQVAVRRRQRAVVAARQEAIEAYEATTPYRNHMLLLLNLLVALYLITCLYLIALFGRRAGHALHDYDVPHTIVGSSVGMHTTSCVPQCATRCVPCLQL